ncbi:MAG: NADH-quinone oxidoreductase subunit D [Candidatus Woesearchaeota archaeon]|nr:NADH-quinone oxidoreductase subunit D [Candidatus Woesearchaeota archaeon]
METALNIGPQHPSTHGVLRMKTIIDGEIVKKCEPDVGYIHRGLEKIAENRMYFKFTPVANKIDYLAAAAWEHCYISCVEQVLDMDVPERVKWARMLMLELQRIVSHLFWIGTLCMDIGQPTVFVWAMREREKFLDIFEEVMGGRMTYGWMIIGGLRDDITPSQVTMMWHALEEVEKRLPEYYRMTEKNHIFKKRLQGIGVITKEEAIAYGLTGAVARASGVPYDVRKDDPYLKYEEVEWEMITREAGDCWARYEVKRDEIYQSISIAKQAIKKLPNGPFRLKNAATLRPPTALSLKTPENGEAFVRNECPRGEGCIYLRTDGSNFPYRLRIRGPSFNNLCILDHVCRGATIPDVVAILATLDPVFGECDR